MGMENFGGVALFRFHPFGGSLPHLTLEDFGPRDPEKNGFCSGGIAPPFGGDMNFLPVCTLAHFFLSYVYKIFDFLSQSKVRTANFRS